MPAKWPKNTIFKEVTLEVENKVCRHCGSKLFVCDHRVHCIYTLEGPLKLICKLVHCSNGQCSNHSILLSPEAEITLTMPRWRIGWDVFAWMGFRRFKRHWSIPQLQGELSDTYQISLSENTINTYLEKYQIMVSARHQDFRLWQEEYKDCSDLILTIDGLQPEKGHETLYVVRELRKERIWFAEALLSASTDEIRKLIKRAKELSQQLNKPVRGWVSDKQDVFVTTIAAEFPNTPHRFCDNHFLRDLAKPVLEKDSHVKVQMRKKVRGLRSIEKETLAELDQYTSSDGTLTLDEKKLVESIVMDYCATVRGILNDNHGGPLTPAGLRMSQALEEVSKSLERNLKRRKTIITSKLKRLNGCIKRGLSIYEQDKVEIVKYVKEIKKVFRTLDQEKGELKKRHTRFKRLKSQLLDPNDSIKIHMYKVMNSFEAGLFVGNDDSKIPGDNLDLERWFKKPKGHERKIHGRKHTGIRIVYEGPTLLPALDAHLTRTKPFTYQELLPYIEAEPPESQIKSKERNRIMTKASSKKKE